MKKGKRTKNLFLFIKVLKFIRKKGSKPPAQRPINNVEKINELEQKKPIESKNNKQTINTSIGRL